MTNYAIGSVRGDLNLLLPLLHKSDFDKEKDTLWISGDLINRGPNSLEVLRFVKQQGKQAVTVLGHQELRLLAVAEGVQSQNPDDAFDEILTAPDRDELLKWLRQRPFLHQAKRSH